MTQTNDATMSIVFLQPGETPHDYSTTPGEMDFSGMAADEAVARYEADTGDTIVERWDRDGAVWVITQQAIDAAAERDAE